MKNELKNFLKKQLQDKETALQVFEFILMGNFDFESIAPKQVVIQEQFMPMGNSENSVVHSREGSFSIKGTFAGPKGL